MIQYSISQEESSTNLPNRGQVVCPSRILLVDDDPAVRSLNAEVLSRSGYQVDTATDGVSGWKALKEHHYDVLVTDNTMPGVTGLELIKKLRSEDMMLAVVLASGTAPVEELEHNPWLHIDVLLPKPYKVAELVRAVDTVLHNKTSASH